MCGRYTITKDPQQLEERFDAEPPAESLEPRFNAAPTQELPVLLNEGPRRFELLRWGLVPRWAKDKSVGARMINLRAETVEQKFREPLRRRRCLVPADGFYEWQHSEGRKIPMRITLASGELFAFAGLWETWRDAQGGQLRTFGIITTEANELIAPIHNRMPVILRPEDEQLWLSGTNDAPWNDLLRPYPSDLMAAYPVSTLVNKPTNDSPALIAPV